MKDKKLREFTMKLCQTKVHILNPSGTDIKQSEKEDVA